MKNTKKTLEIVLAIALALPIAMMVFTGPSMEAYCYKEVGEELVSFVRGWKQLIGALFAFTMCFPRSLDFCEKIYAPCAIFSIIISAVVAYSVDPYIRLWGQMIDSTLVTAVVLQSVNVHLVQVWEKKEQALLSNRIKAVGGIGGFLGGLLGSQLTLPIEYVFIIDFIGIVIIQIIFAILRNQMKGIIKDQIEKKESDEMK